MTRTQPPRYHLTTRSGRPVVITELLDWIGHEDHDLAGQLGTAAWCTCGVMLENLGGERVLAAGEDPAEIAGWLGMRAQQDYEQALQFRASSLLEEAVRALAAGRGPDRHLPRGFRLVMFGQEIGITLTHGPEFNGVDREMLGMSTAELDLTAAQRAAVTAFVAAHGRPESVPEQR